MFFLLEKSSAPKFKRKKIFYSDFIRVLPNEILQSFVILYFHVSSSFSSSYHSFGHHLCVSNFHFTSTFFI